MQHKAFDRDREWFLDVGHFCRDRNIRRNGRFVKAVCRKG
jgi:hypothetical protein